jgi:hypothetical protein
LTMALWRRNSSSGSHTLNKQKSKKRDWFIVFNCLNYNGFNFHK